MASKKQGFAQLIGYAAINSRWAVVAKRLPTLCYQVTLHWPTGVMAGMSNAWRVLPTKNAQASAVQDVIVGRASAAHSISASTTLAAAHTTWHAVAGDTGALKLAYSTQEGSTKFASLIMLMPLLATSLL